jgi:predicted metalloprotease with PDZ domain
MFIGRARAFFRINLPPPGSVVYSGAMMCQERIRLVADYRETTRTYADFVRKMTDLVGLGVESEIDLLQRSCRMAWEAAEKARLALFRHEANHSCNRSDFRASAASTGTPHG